MEYLNLPNSFCNEIKKGGIGLISIVCLTFLVASCAENSVNTTEDPSTNNELTSSTEISPHAILGSGSFAETIDVITGSKSKRSQATSENNFVSPLFGLATAPNGDILVADAGSGIATLDGDTEISLPGISDMSPIGRGAMWGHRRIDRSSR